jgi:hypothetical protein
MEGRYMMQQTMMELANPFDVIAKAHGRCLVKYIIIGSTSSNPQYILRQYDTGFHRVVDMTEIAEYGNPSAGESLIPKTPEEWQKHG